MKDLETRKVNASLTNPCAALQDEKCLPYTSRDCSDQYIITAVLALFSVTFSRLTQNQTLIQLKNVYYCAGMISGEQ